MGVGRRGAALKLLGAVGGTLLVLRRNLRVLGKQVVRRGWVSREFHGMQLKLAPAVFDPTLGEGSTLLGRYLERHSAGLRVLDLGTGSGGLALVATRSSARAVTASDIRLASLVCAHHNVRRNATDGSVRLLAGDLFSPLQPQGKFDLICWNPPFLPHWLPLPRTLYAAVCDPGHGRLVTALREHRRLLKPGGLLVFAFSDLGRWCLVAEAAYSQGLTLRSRDHTEMNGIGFWLVEVRS